LEQILWHSLPGIKAEAEWPEKAGAVSNEQLEREGLK
jgi:hypothetical protein